MAVTSINQYRIDAERIDEFVALLEGHVAVLRDLELITERPVQVYAGTDKDGGGYVVEIFDWVDDDASHRAHVHPAVSQVWESMGPFADARGGRSPFEFANLPQVR